MPANYLESILGDNPNALLAIREIPMFRNCSDGLLGLVYRYGRIVHLEEGEELIREGEFDQWVYMILSGVLTVHLGGEHVDTVSSSLVGERCILGEPRRATLKAAPGGVNALGIDMAILDWLENPRGQAPPETDVYKELFALITAEAVERVAKLEFNQTDTAARHHMFIHSDALADTVVGLMENRFQSDREQNMILYDHLSRTDRVSMALSMGEDRVTLNTAKLVALYTSQGRHGEIWQLAEHLLARRKDSRLDVAPPFFSYQAFLESTRQKVGVYLAKTLGMKPEQKGLSQENWREHLMLDEGMKVDLGNLSRWMQYAFGLNDRDMIALLRLLFQEACATTAAINATIQSMIGRMRSLAFVQKLGQATAGGEAGVVELFHSKTVEEMIPVFSRTIIQVHLIEPMVAWQEKMNRGQKAPSAGAAATLSSQDMIEDLFR
ncbi:MAG: hypothetical protein OEV94_07450 [Deltaproteobacteria bacterium]|nr:hypothetical protein [Deltaproteobacteria bacterium]